MGEYAEGHFQASVHVPDADEGNLENIVPTEVLSLGRAPPAAHMNEAAASTNHATAVEVTEDGAAMASTPPWLFAFDPSDEAPPELRIRLVVIVGSRGDFGANFAERLICHGVRHVVCLLGGAGALRADAPRYLT